jgi:autotransporter-associated beta strand protein
MKTQLTKITTQPVKKHPSILASRIRLFLVLMSLFVATSAPAPALDAVWLVNPSSGDWNTGTNWSTSPSAPVNAGDTATFDTSTQTSLSLSSNVTVESITFQPGASAFTIATTGNVVLTVQGTGIVNNSGDTQTIINDVLLNEFFVASAGSTNFLNSSTAGNATITNYNVNLNLPGLAVGSTKFFNASTAGNATINNFGGDTEFLNSSTAGNATITNIGIGFTQFLNTSTAGNATISNFGGVGTGNFGEGSTIFSDTSTAGNATITNNPGGSTGFSDNATAGNATITNFFGGSTGFSNNATAGKATIVNTFGSTGFSDNATAGNATITNFSGGSTGFSNNATAGKATIVNTGGSGDPFARIGGFTEFADSSTAGNATIINNSGVAGGFGGSTSFANSSTAGNATIITNSGGMTLFSDSSDGGTARAITNGNGSFDISGLTTAGMGIGSIEGSGNYFLGSKTLTVGGNNLSTTVSGVIQDGGIEGGAGGSLTKVGTGTLTLTGTNSYTGPTTVNAGVLIVDGSIASAHTLVNAGGLLGGHGSLGGSLVNSGIVSPGNSPGTLTVNGNYTQNTSGTLRIEVAGPAPSQHDLLAVNGHATLAGTLQLIGLGSFTLHVGNQVTFLTASGGVSGTFGTVLATATLVKAQVVDLPNAVVLEGTQGSFVEEASTPNTVAVAQALDSAVGDPRASTLVAFLNEEPLNKLFSDFGLISPEALASIFNIGVSLANVQSANLKRRRKTSARAAPALVRRALR